MPIERDNEYAPRPSYKTDAKTLRWLVVHTQNRQEEKLAGLLKGYIARQSATTGGGNIIEVYRPTQKVRTVSEGKVRETPAMSGFVFVHATEYAATAFLLKHYPEGFLLRDRTTDDVMTIPEDEMRQFMDFNAQEMEELLVLERPFYQYSNNLRNIRARVNNGPFAGKEGVLIHLRNERRLVFRLGDLAISIAQVWKYDLTRINTTCDGTEPSPEEKAVRPMRVVDRLEGLLQKAGLIDDAPAALRFIVDRLQTHRTITRLKTAVALEGVEVEQEARPTETEQKNSTSRKSENEKTYRPDYKKVQKFLSALTEDAAADLKSLAHLLQEAPEMTETLIPLNPLRPFLTPGAQVKIPTESQRIVEILPHRHFTELVCPVEIEELFHDRSTDTTAPRRIVYDARVALVPIAKSTTDIPTTNTPVSSLLIADWSAIITPYRLLEGKAKAEQDKILASWCPALLELLHGNHPFGLTVRSVSLPDGHVLIGPSISVTAEAKNWGDKTLKDFLNPLLDICATISASTHLAALRRSLQRIWLPVCR
ncbi:MAG: transcription termination/antitermination NusG family protein [Bacteroidales bacterium]|nr:transcription termination/antitermination NusG family protein [Bacteroidales bacterium]